MPFRVLLLAGAIDRQAGSHFYHKQLIRQLANRGHSVTAMCFNADNDVRNYAEIHQLPLRRFHESRFFWRFASALESMDLRRRVRNNGSRNVDVVIAGEHLLIPAVVGRGGCRVPWVYLPHSLNVTSFLNTVGMPASMKTFTIWHYRRIQAWAMRHSDCTLRFTKQSCRALMRSYGGKVRPRFVVNPMGVEFPTIDRRTCGSGETRILSVSQLAPGKRLHAAIAALSLLKNESWHFDIVGDGVARRELQEMTSRMHLDGRVTFHGYQADPSRWYREADLFLLPSQSENCPLALLEAMSFGVPCLAMKPDNAQFESANDELMTDGVDGFLAASDEHFVSLLGDCIRDPKRLHLAGQRARERVMNEHSWERHIDCYETVFEMLTSENHSKGNPADKVCLQ